MKLMNNTKRSKVQGIVATALIYILFSSKNLPLLITAYLATVSWLLSIFNYIRDEELKKTKEYGDKNFWSQTITMLFLQFLTLGFIYLISWWLIEKKLNFHF